MTRALTLALLSGIFFAAGAETGAAPAKAVRLRPASKELLLAMKDATGAAPFLITDRDTDPVKELVKNAYILFNEPTAAVVDGKKQVQAILSPDGKTKADSYSPKVSENPRGPLPKPEDFEVEDNVEMPDFSASRRIARAIYPFDKLVSVGQSFFIPAPENYDGDNFASTKAGTVGTQTRKAKELWEKEDPSTRSAKPAAYKVSNDTKNGVKGARVFRTE